MESEKERKAKVLADLNTDLKRLRGTMTLGGVLAHKMGIAPEEPKVKWIGGVPDACEACGGEWLKQKYFYDASINGRWGIICGACFKAHKCGLGVGRGQKYDRKTLEKVEG